MEDLRAVYFPYGEQARVTYDTLDGAEFSANANIAYGTGLNNHDFNLSLALPIVPGEGINIDASSTETALVISAEATGASVFTLTALTAAAMPAYTVASKSTTMIKYGENTYTYAGENGDGVGSWEIRYLCVTGSSAAGTEVYANWLSLQYQPGNYAAVAVTSSSGWIGATAVTPSGATAAATSGTLTIDEYSTLTSSNSNYILFNNECYYLADKQHTAGMLTYAHTGYNGGDGVTKYFNITTSTRAWTLVESRENKIEFVDIIFGQAIPSATLVRLKQAPAMFMPRRYSSSANGWYVATLSSIFLAEDGKTAASYHYSMNYVRNGSFIMNLDIDATTGMVTNTG